MVGCLIVRRCGSGPPHDSGVTGGGWRALADSCSVWPYQHDPDIGHVGAGGAGLNEATSGG